MQINGAVQIEIDGEDVAQAIVNDLELRVTELVRKGKPSRELDRAVLTVHFLADFYGADEGEADARVNKKLRKLMSKVTLAVVDGKSTHA